MVTQTHISASFVLANQFRKTEWFIYDFLTIAHISYLLIVSILCGNDEDLCLRECLMAYCLLSMEMCMIDDNTHYITVQEKGLMGTYWHAWQAPVSAF